MEATVAFLLAHPLVRRIEVLEEVRAPESSFLALKATLRDGSVLFIREAEIERTRKYSYHWQDAYGVLRIRWDNSPHHRKILTFPHHKHAGTSGRVVASDATTLSAVLVEIEEELK